MRPAWGLKRLRFPQMSPTTVPSSVLRAPPAPIAEGEVMDPTPYGTGAEDFDRPAFPELVPEALARPCLHVAVCFGVAAV